MSDKSIDPLEKPQEPLRVNYANGILLDEDDFRSEQVYFRGRLSRALAYLHGFGTVAGLDVEPLGSGDKKHTLKVGAGLAIDRIGRLIELRLPYCLRAEKWFETQQRNNPDVLESSFANSDAGDGNKAVVADLFIRFEVCNVGKTPSFGLGNVDATDAFSDARLRDSAALELVLRTMPEAEKPQPSRPDTGLPAPDPANPLPFGGAMDELHKFKREKAWRESELWNEVDARIIGGLEHAAHQNGTELLIARIRFPATGNPLRYDTNGDIHIDRDIRVLSLSNYELRWLMNATGGS